MIKNFFQSISTLALLAFCSIASAQTPAAQGAKGTLASMFVAFQPSVQSLIKLTIAASMIIGLYLVINSIYKLATLGESGGQRGDSAKGPLIMFFCGIALFGLMLSLRTVGETMMMGSGPGNFLMPTNSALNGPSAAAVVAIMWFIRLIGFIAIIRGFLLLNKHGQGGQQGELGRGLTHILGGTACVHIDFTARVMANTFAPGMSLPF